MTRSSLFLAAGIAMFASTNLAGAPPRPISASVPPGDASTRYCLRIEPPTGSRIEEVWCRTRGQWIDLGIDLDREWPREGAGVRG